MSFYGWFYGLHMRRVMVKAFFNLKIDNACSYNEEQHKGYIAWE